MQIVEIALYIMQVETPVEFDWFYMKPYTTVSFFFEHLVLYIIFKGFYGECERL